MDGHPPYLYRVHRVRRSVVQSMYKRETRRRISNDIQFKVRVRGQLRQSVFGDGCGRHALIETKPPKVSRVSTSQKKTAVSALSVLLFKNNREYLEGLRRWAFLGGLLI